MPNTSSAKKALRGSLKKRQYNNVKKYKIKQSLKELRRVLATKPSEYQTTLSKVFSALDKAVKTNLIPRSRANRKKSRVTAMVDKALGREVANNAARKAAKKQKQANKKSAAPKAKAPAKKPVAKKPVTKKTEDKKPATKKPAAKKVTVKATAKKSTTKKTTTKK